MSTRPVLGNSYVPPFPPDYSKLPWYERDLVAYFNYLDYKEMADKIF